MFNIPIHGNWVDFNDGVACLTEFVFVFTYLIINERKSYDLSILFNTVDIVTYSEI